MENRTFYNEILTDHNLHPLCEYSQISVSAVDNHTY